MTTKNILIVGAVGVLAIYLLSGQTKKAAAQLQPTQYGGYLTDPQNVQANPTFYRV